MLKHDSSAGSDAIWKQRFPWPWFESWYGTNNADSLFGNWLVLKIASTFKTHMRLLYKNKLDLYRIFCLFSYTPMRFEHGIPLSQTTRSTQWSSGVTSVDQLHNANYIMLRIYFMFHRAILLQWKWRQSNEHWTTRVHKALPAKGIHKNLRVCFPNISVQVEFNWYQTSVCWDISILHYRGTKHPKSRVQVHPYGHT